MATFLTPPEGSERPRCTLRLHPGSPFRRMIGVGGIGTGMFFALEGNQTLGRSESRLGRLLDTRDYCKLHIVSHYVAVLLGADPAGSRFHVLPIAKVGADEAGRRLKDELARVGADITRVEAVDGLPTLFSVCFQYPDGAGGNITTSHSAAAALTEADIDCCEAILERDGARSIALAMPEVPLECRDHLLKVATKYRSLRVASFATAEVQLARDAGMLSRIDILALNEDEASILAGKSFDPDDPEPVLRDCAEVLVCNQPQIRAVVSAGKQGAFAFAGGNWAHYPAPSVSVASTAGAGDALIAGILAGLSAGMPFMHSRAPDSPRSIATALDVGVLLAAYSVTSPHTIHPDANLEVLVTFASHLGMTLTDIDQYCEYPALAGGAATDE